MLSKAYGTVDLACNICIAGRVQRYQASIKTISKLHLRHISQRMPCPEAPSGRFPQALRDKRTAWFQGARHLRADVTWQALIWHGRFIPQDTKKIVENEGRKCLLIRGDLEAEEHCLEV